MKNPDPVADSDTMEVLKTILVYEESHDLIGKPFELPHGWEWPQVGVPGRTLHRLCERGLLTLIFRSNNYKVYRLASPTALRDMMADATPPASSPETAPAPPSVPVVPPDIFAPIVGYDDVKALVLGALRAARPVHVLFTGSPATGKTTFLDEIARIAGSAYALGGSSTKAGLSRFIVDARPGILLIDEVHYMAPDDASVLLTLMESQRIVETKAGRRLDVPLECRVFAACNTTIGLRPELRDRFLEISLPEYSEIELRDVVTNVLVMREGIEGANARAIADICIRGGMRSVRRCVSIARLSGGDPIQADKNVGTIIRYRIGATRV